MDRVWQPFARGEGYIGGTQTFLRVSIEVVFFFGESWILTPCERCASALFVGFPEPQRELAHGNCTVL